jgi:hypothetical protein
MISAKSRRAITAFHQSLEIHEASPVRNVTDNLSNELGALHRTLQKNSLNLSLRSYWVEGDLSMVIILERQVHGEQQPLLQIELTPLSSKKAQAIFKYTNNEQKAVVKRHDYSLLDTVYSVERLFADIRRYILLTTPFNMRDEIQDIFLGVDTSNKKETEDSRAMLSSLASKQGLPPERVVELVLRS